MDKTKEALLYLASKFGSETVDEIQQILCEHNVVTQEADDYCSCNECGRWITIESYRERLEYTPGILYLSDGTKEYKSRGV